MAGTDLDAVLKRWKDALGAAAFEAAKPGQTLRPAPGSAAPAQTIAQTSAPDATPGASKSSFIPPRDVTLSQWNEYTIHDLVGEGGMGQIHRAEQGSLRRDVAIKKIIPGQLDEAEDKREAFVSEALVTGFLDHPNIVPVYALGQDCDGKWFFSMKLVRGISWKDLLHPGQIEDPAKRAQALERKLDIDDPARRAEQLEANLRILLSVCNAVAFAHSKHVIHRDLKPENVMVGAFGEVLVMDWGLAVDVSETAPPPSSQRVPHRSDPRVGVGGTPAYMAPEQTYGDGSRLGAQTDVFLLGAILHELVAGAPPNSGDSMIESLTKASQCAAPVLPNSAPQELRDVCKHALAKNPADRHASAGDFQQAIEGYFKHKESALIASRAEQEAKGAEIRNLARAVVLYEQAVAMWPENQPARSGAETARTTLTRKERTVRTIRRAAVGLAAAIFLVVTIAFFWIRAEQQSTEKQRSIAVDEKNRADKEAAAKTFEADEKEKQRKVAVEQKDRAESLVQEAARKAKGASEAAFDARHDEPQGFAYLAEAVRYTNGLGEKSKARTIYCDAATRITQSNERFPHLGLRHENSVKSASFSPDGKWVVTASSDKTARVWDAATGQPVGAPLRHAAGVASASFSPDGKWVLTASWDNTARVWDAATGQAVGAPLRHDGFVYCASFSPDGRWVVTASADKTARVWDAATGQAVGPPLRHDGQVASASFSPDGRWVVTASNDKTARVWDVATGQLVGAPLRHADGVNSASFSPDGKWVVTASEDHTARVWDAATGQDVGAPLRHDSFVFSARFSPDGKRVVTASWDNTARVWDATTGQPVGARLQHENIVNSASFSPDGRWVVTASNDKTARVWDAATGQPVGAPLRHEDLLHSAIFSPDGKWVVTASNDKTARLWDAATGQAVGAPLRHEGSVSNGSLSPNGKWVATASFDKTAQLWDAATGQAVGAPLRHDSSVSSASFSPDSKRVVTASDDKTARVWDAATGQAVGAPLLHEYSVVSARFSSDGKWVVTASWDSTARVWDAATGQPVGAPLRHEDGVNSASFSPDGKWVVTASDDKTAQVWDAATGQPMGAPLRHEDGVNSASFSPDGKRVVTASRDNTARAWDAATGQPVGASLQHENIVNSASYSPDGKWVVTASYDKTARVWDAATGQPVGAPLRHEDSVNSASFSPDGKWVVTASNDNTARVWDAATGQPVGAPLRHDSWVFDASFSPDGKRVVTESRDNTARVWDAPLRCEIAKPETLLAMGGKQVDAMGRLTDVPIEQRLEWRRNAASAQSDPTTRRIIQWFLSDSRTRTISLQAKLTVPQHIEREIDWVIAHPNAENNQKILDDAYALDPTHPLIHFVLAAIEKDKDRADFFKEYGLKRLPADPAIRAKAAAILRKQGDEARALRAEAVK